MSGYGMLFGYKYQCGVVLTQSAVPCSSWGWSGGESPNLLYRICLMVISTNQELPHQNKIALTIQTVSRS